MAFLLLLLFQLENKTPAKGLADVFHLVCGTIRPCNIALLDRDLTTCAIWEGEPLPGV